MRRRLRESVVVVTGASSGIGRATALEFARRGAAVVVTARRDEPLEEVAEQCRQLGGRALAVPVDIDREDEVEAMAQLAVETFGRIDVWVNNAAVTLLGRFIDSPADVYRQVIETNLFGYIHGARAAMKRFYEQGRGVLINNASMVGKMAEPYVSAYVTSKFGIVGLSESLRQETYLDGVDVHVCTVLPATIDTPFFQHAGNYADREINAMPPVYGPEKVARTIVGLAERPRREVVVGNSARMLMFLHTLAPAVAERFIARQFNRSHMQDKPARIRSGNILEPMAEGTNIHGGWRDSNGRSGRKAAMVGLATVGLAALPAVGWLLYRQGSR